MDNSKPVSTPVENENKLVKGTDDDELADTELYQSADSSLLYLSTKTRPDIAYAVGNVARSSPKPSKIQLDHEMMHRCIGNIAGFSDADWAGDHEDRKSTSGLHS